MLIEEQSTILDILQGQKRKKKKKPYNIFIQWGWRLEQPMRPQEPD